MKSSNNADDLYSIRYIPAVGYENGNTFAIMLEDGLVSKIELPEHLTLNGKNMMRALASTLQMDTTAQEMEMWTRKEVKLIVMAIPRVYCFPFVEKYSW